MIGGEVLNGKYSRAGHLGHISIDPNGKTGILQLPGTLEVAIGNATVRERTQGKFDTTLELIKAFNAGDEYAQDAWDRFVFDLARTLCSLTNILSPELIIIGGGISRAGDALFNPLEIKMDQMEWRPTGTATPVVPAQFEQHAGAVGAAAFVMKKFGILN
ncbi:MAG: ROK family protein, partial [Cyclobacteriaceae bacterium]